MIDLVRNHAVSFFATHELNSPIKNIVLMDKPDLEELISTLKDRSYNIFYSNLQEKYIEENKLNTGIFKDNHNNYLT